MNPIGLRLRIKRYLSIASIEGSHEDKHSAEISGKKQSKKSKRSEILKKSGKIRLSTVRLNTEGLKKSKILQQTEEWLENYFSRKFSNLKMPVLDLHGTPFEVKTWKELLKIKTGKTTSYGDIATRIKNPNAQRAVGRAVGSNPIAIMVPCHRIIGANGALTGFRGGLNRKVWLLEHEDS